MINSIRYLVVGAGALGVAGGATYFGIERKPEKSSDMVLAASSPSDDFEICLKTDIQFFEGVTAKCYSRTELFALRDATLVNHNADPVVLDMTHPTNSTAETAQCTTCREYSEMEWEGWYALSSRDMRREAFFVRACGVLDALTHASLPTESYFEGGSPNALEMAALRNRRALRITEGNAATDGVSPSAPPTKVDDHHWRLASADQGGILQEIANADFDDDGIEEILVFLTTSPEEGTAIVSEVGLLEKDSADTPVSLTPLAFGPDGKAEAGL